MRIKQSIVISGFLLSALGLLSAKDALASWVIDSSGSLIEISDLAFDFNQAVDPLIARMGISENQKGSQEQKNSGSDSQLGEMNQNQNQYQTQEQVEQEAEKKRQELQEQREQKAQEAKQVMEKKEQYTQSTVEVVGEQIKIRQEVLDKKTKAMISFKEMVLPKNEPLYLEKKDGSTVQVKPDNKGNLEISGKQLKTEVEGPMQVGANQEIMLASENGEKKSLKLFPEEVAEKLQKQNYTVVDQNVELKLEQQEGSTYAFKVQEQRKLLGIFPLNFEPREMRISTETGDVISSGLEGASFAQKLMHWLSF